MQGFRPHEGDPSSLQTGETQMAEVREFPSPRRGSIFSTLNKNLKEDTNYVFPSPRREPIFSTDSNRNLQHGERVSVPTEGTHLLYYDCVCGKRFT